MKQHRSFDFLWFVAPIFDPLFSGPAPCQICQAGERKELFAISRVCKLSVSFPRLEGFQILLLSLTATSLSLSQRQLTLSSFESSFVSKSAYFVLWLFNCCDYSEVFIISQLEIVKLFLFLNLIGNLDWKIKFSQYLLYESDNVKSYSSKSCLGIMIECPTHCSTVPCSSLRSQFELCLRVQQFSWSINQSITSQPVLIKSQVNLDCGLSIDWPWQAVKVSSQEGRMYIAIGSARPRPFPVIVTNSSNCILNLILFVCSNAHKSTKESLLIELSLLFYSSYSSTNVIE